MKKKALPKTGRYKTLFPVILLLLVFTACPGWASDYLNDLEDAFEAHITNDFDKAIDLYTRIIKSREVSRRNLPVLYLLRGEAWAEKGDCTTAIKDFTTAIKLRPSYAHAYYFRGDCYQNQGKYKQAWQDFKTAISLKPNKRLYLESRALLASLIGKEEKRAVSFAAVAPPQKASKLSSKSRKGKRPAFLEFLRSPWSFIKSAERK